MAPMDGVYLVRDVEGLGYAAWRRWYGKMRSVLSRDRPEATGSLATGTGQP